MKINPSFAALLLVASFGLAGCGQKTAEQTTINTDEPTAREINAAIREAVNDTEAANAEATAKTPADGMTANGETAVPADVAPDHDATRNTGN